MMYNGRNWRSTAPSDQGYWPGWESHYAPIEKTRNRLHHRNNYAPPAYSASVSSASTQGQHPHPSYPRPRRGYGLLDLEPPVIPTSLRRAEAALALPTDQLFAPRGYAASMYPVALFVRYEVSSIEATVMWDTPTFRQREPAYFTYFLHLEGADRSETLELASWKTRLSFPVAPGSFYKVSVKAVTPENFIAARGETEFKAIFDAQELQRTYNLALEYLRPLNEKCSLGGMQRFYVFYRNKPTAYFDHVRLNDHGIMKKYRKDDNGHPASPINGKIDGLFFNARQPGGQMPKTSPFGNVRMSVDAEYLFTPMHKLYFCDFYCNNSTHYVTVVACIPDSLTDQFCNRYLMPLDPTNNMFLFAAVNPYTGDMEHYVNGSIWVEFYYTEDVPLSWGFFDQVYSTGQSKPNGVPNNKTCTICNLYPIMPALTPVSRLIPEPSTSRQGTKRRASLDEPRDEPRNRKRIPSLVNIPISAADFEPPKKRQRSTFHRAMELERKTTVDDGKRLECADPFVLEVVCYLVDQVVKDESGNDEGTTTSSDTTPPVHGDVSGSEATSMTSLLQRSTASSASDQESPSLIDKEIAAQTDALVSFSNRKDVISKLVKNVNELVSEAKKSAEALCTKLLKLDH